MLRALTEAAQGRLTLISGSRDDLSESLFNDAEIRSQCAETRKNLAPANVVRTFRDAPDTDNEAFDSDVQWELQCIVRSGIQEAIAVNLTQPEFGIPVVRVVIPYLESISELQGYVPGIRARKVMREAPQCAMS